MSWQDTYQDWKENKELVEDLRADLVRMEGNQDELEDAFYAPLEFGTAGMRGVLGAGINRMNIYTVRQATEGLALFMETLDEETRKRGVAISYDSRHHSQDFAFESARVLGQHGIPTFVFESLRPTPELSFTVRHLHTYAGIMITASHNPKQYNGYKIYGEDGAQMPPKESDLITKYIRKVDDLFAIKVADQEELIEDGVLKVIGDEVDKAYLDEVKQVTINQELVAEEGKTMELIFTPLHGTGAMLGEKALRQAGFENFTMVPEQAKPDPDFSTVKKPNPEDTAAFDLAIKLGKEEGADLLVAVDPDADRLGAAVRQPDGEYQLLTGNQIAAIMLNYILTARKNAGTLPANAAAVKSIVSSEFATKIAESFNVDMINVLTGFKFIAEQIKHFEDTNEHTFMFGFEESYGYLVRPFVRDKDAVISSMLICEMAAYYRSIGSSLKQRLEEIYTEYGRYLNVVDSFEFPGLTGMDKMAGIMQELRDNPPAAIGERKVVSVTDYKNTEATGLPSANVLTYGLDNGATVVVRPSGTEPKIKTYFTTLGKDLAEAQAIKDELAAALAPLFK